MEMTTIKLEDIFHQSRFPLERRVVDVLVHICPRAHINTLYRHQPSG